VNTQTWQGLSVRTRDGYVLGVVTGTFTDGVLAGRLRVEGREPRVDLTGGLPSDTRVYAVPCRAVRGREQDSLMLDVSLGVARGRWLMHVVRTKGA
jgi:hypothetical protein